MGFNCGIVGLPNVGKSTIFNALTKSENAESANYPFCTIDPNRGIVTVPDARVDKLVEVVVPKNTVRSTIEFLDIAGLVKGASQGEGLGNKFLGNIRQVDAIAHVVRCFVDDNVVHVDGSVDPLRDIDVINTELLMSDMEILERAVERTKKLAKSGNKDQKKKLELLESVYEKVGEGIQIREIEGIEDIAEEIREFNFITLKPVMYVMNVDEGSLAEDNEYVKQVRELAEKEGAKAVKICGAVEAELVDLDEEEAKEYLNELGMERSGLDSMIAEGYKLLDLIDFFTAGVQEVRAWTITKGTPAQKAAGKIHTDIERGFIRAEVTSYADFEACGTQAKAKELGKMRLEGKEYIVQDGDIIYFRFNV